MEKVYQIMSKAIAYNYTAKAGIDIACHDILGKSVNLPLYKLMGGLSNEMETDITVSINTPEYMAKKAKEHVSSGFNIIKTKVGIDVETDVARVKAIREALAGDVKEALDAGKGSADLQAAMRDWLDNMNAGEGTRDRADKLTALLEAEKGSDELLNKIYENKGYFVKRSQWIFGGDGWAYDIGYGGLDHVLASGEDVNVFVFDTEVYSNTGGQASKSTPAAAIAQFAATGKKTKKKDLGMMAMSYGYVYVAQVCMGANHAQTVKAIAEAEAYPGPSLIIGYAPCINHGIKMNKSQLEEKKAVEAGYWSTYRYDPQLRGTDKNPFQLDSTPTPDFGKFQDFLQGEVRYKSLQRKFPDTADKLFEKTQHDAEGRLAGYKKLAGK